MSLPRVHEHKPGEKVAKSGIYDVVHDRMDGERHAHDHRVSVVSGTKFPPCRGCGHGVRYRLHEAVQHIKEHPLLQHTQKARGSTWTPE
ncbi:MAG TPA: hypothetical protein VMU47_09430 [Caldimonas sp.]|nr:hypothetical protein [Caldimonas sp.]